MSASNITHGRASANVALILAFLSQNFSMGIVVGSFGPLVPIIERDFSTSRSLSSLGIALIALVLGLLSPVVGVLLRTISVRAVITTGSLVMATGYFLLSRAETITQLLVLFAVLIGPGMAMMSAVAPATLVSRWFEERHRGKALGLVSMPIMLVLVPPIASLVANSWGLAAWFMLAGLLFLAMCPIMLLIVDHPAGSKPDQAEAANRPDISSRPEMPVGTLIRSPQFWLLTIGVGILTGVGQAYLAHIVSFAKNEGLSAGLASYLLTAFAGAGLFGTFAMGWLSDRIGASSALALSGLVQGLLWLLLLFAVGFWQLLLLASLIGFLCTSVIAMHAAAANEHFGSKNVSVVMGFGYFVKVPFIFLPVPFAAILFDMTGRYDLAFLVFSMFLLISALAFFWLRLLKSRATCAQDRYFHDGSRTSAGL